MKIAIHGKKEAGKSTLADYLVETWGYDAFSFAHNLKLEVMDMGIPASVMMKKPTVPWLRKLLQYHGQHRRVESLNYWIMRCWDDIINTETGKPVIDDMRYLNEAEWARAQGYKLVKIRKVGSMSADNHASETDLDDWHDWDCVIEVYPSELEEMYAQIDDFVMGELDATD